jgi:thiamine biosynthesis protein ThiS
LRAVDSRPAPKSMRIVVNGKDQLVPAGTTVAELCALLGVERGRVAVERNQDVVPRQRYDEVVLVAGDHVEVVAFVGGG